MSEAKVVAAVPLNSVHKSGGVPNTMHLAVVFEDGTIVYMLHSLDWSGTPMAVGREVARVRVTPPLNASLKTA